MSRTPKSSSGKPGLHPRNRHAARYDLADLAACFPPLAAFVQQNPVGDDTIDFANPAAVTALNTALLKRHYGLVHWEIPPGYLCPPVPGRADYVHHVADLLGEGREIPRGPAVAVLDIGVGANCVYPIIGVAEYGWRFVGTDIDAGAISAARRLVARNPLLAERVECRLQPSAGAIFAGVVKSGETFALSLCNPPFHASAADAAAGTARKLRNLHGGTVAARTLNFGGRHNELWCAGGELGFVQRMIRESAERPALCGWFTTLVSKRDNLPAIERALRAVDATEVRIIPLSHGQKQSRIVAWRFAVRRQGERGSAASARFDADVPVAKRRKASLPKRDRPPVLGNASK